MTGVIRIENHPGGIVKVYVAGDEAGTLIAGQTLVITPERVLYWTRLEATEKGPT